MPKKADLERNFKIFEIPAKSESLRIALKNFSQKNTFCRSIIDVADGVVFVEKLESTFWLMMANQVPLPLWKKTTDYICTTHNFPTAQKMNSK